MSATGIFEIVNSNISVPVTGAINSDLVIRTETLAQKLLLSNGSNVVPGITLSNNYVGIGKTNPASPLDVANDISYSGSLVQNGTKLRFCNGSAVGSASSTPVTVTFPFTFTTIPSLSFSCSGAVGYLVHANWVNISTSNFTFICPCVGMGNPPNSYYGNNIVYWNAIGS